MEGQSKEGYRFLEHVTDAIVEAWGATFEKALVQASLGFLDTIVNASRVRLVLTEKIEAEGHDELELIYNWLEELLLYFETKREVYREFAIEPVQATSKGLKVKAEARGEQYDPATHGSKIEVKGVTYHLMEVRREPGLVRIKYLLDL